MTLKTTRNWLAHRCLEKWSLLTVAFLFGIGLRGLLGEELRKKIDTTSDDENINEYKHWESELLALLAELDSEKNFAGKIEMSELIKKSREEFFKRIKNVKEKTAHNKTICDVIQDCIGQKKYGIERREEDLLRDFLHGIFLIKSKTEEEYLNAVKNTLAQAVEGK